MSVLRFLASRLGFYAIAAFVALTINFFLPRLLPGDPATAIFGRFQGKLQPEALEALKEAFGLADAPLFEQYFTYLGHVLTGDFGPSVSHFPEPVSAVIGQGLLWTVLLVGLAVVISFIIGTALGVFAAWRRGGRLDRWLPPILALVGAFPYFWLAMLMLYIFGFELGWFPVRHAHSDHLEPAWTLTFIGDVLAHAALPALSVIIVSLGGWLLSMRNSMIAVLGDESIALARMKGLSPRKVMWRYAARNAIIPNVTSFGMALGFVLGGSLLTEVVFGYPGTGYLMLEAIQSQDYPLMQGLFLAITLAVLAANFLVDIALIFIDPRTRIRR